MFNLELNEFNPYVLEHGMDYLTLVELSNSLKEVKASMEKSKNFLVENTFDFGENVDAIAAIETQLRIVDKNIDAFNKALLMKEAVPFEHELKFESQELHIFCLN